MKVLFLKRLYFYPSMSLVRVSLNNLIGRFKVVPKRNLEAIIKMLVLSIKDRSFGLVRY